MLKATSRVIISALAIFALACGAASAAQKTSGVIKAEAASKFPANGRKQVTAPDVNSSFQDVADSFIPILSANSNCFWKANGPSNPATCEVAAGATDASLLTSGTLNAARLPSVATRNDTVGTFSAQKIFSVVPRLPLTGYVKANGVGADPTASSSIPVSDVSGVMPANQGGAGAINGVMQANGSGTVSAFSKILMSTLSWNELQSLDSNPGQFFEGSYFTNPGFGRVSRFNRIFVGTAVHAKGDIPQTSPQWPENYLANWTGLSQLSSTSAIGALAITGAARTSSYRAAIGATSGGSQGVTGIGINDDAVGGAIACGVCGVAGQAVATGIALNQMDAGSIVPTLVPTPAGGVTGGMAFTLGLTAGAYPVMATHDISAAMYISGSQGNKFHKGIIFFANTLSPAEGQSGAGVAIEMLRGNEVRWLSGSNARDASLFSEASALRILANEVILGDLNTDSTTKTIRLTGEHYLNAQANFAIILGNATSTLNLIRIGGGSGSYNSATSIHFHTGATNTTLSGTERWNISSAGHFLASTDNAVDIGASGASRPKNIFISGYHDFSEITAPSGPPANGARLYCDDNGAGKTRCSIIFATGAAQQIAIEP